MSSQHWNTPDGWHVERWGDDSVWVTPPDGVRVPLCGLLAVPATPPGLDLHDEFAVERAHEQIELALLACMDDEKWDTGEIAADAVSRLQRLARAAVPATPNADELIAQLGDGLLIIGPRPEWRQWTVAGHNHEYVAFGWSLLEALEKACAANGTTDNG